MADVTQAQREHFDREGYVVVSGLIPDDLVQRAESAMWQFMEVDPGDPSTWSSANQPWHRVRGADEDVFLDLYTDRFMAVLHELARIPDGTVGKPTRTMTINAFPSDTAWRWHSPHLDHGNREFEYLPFPRAYYMAAQIYLNDVAHHGGGIALWPGSPRKLAEIIRSKPERYDRLYKVQEDLDGGGIDIGVPVDVTGDAGDVIFYDWLMIHCGSENNQSRPRFAVNWKFPGEQAEPAAAASYRAEMAAAPKS